MLLDYAWAHVTKLEEIESRNLDVDTALTEAGIQPRLRSTSTNPKFQDIRDTETIHYWIKDTIKIGYNNCLQLQAQLKARRVTSVEERKKRTELNNEPFADTSSQSPCLPHFAILHILVQTAPSRLSGHVC